MTGGRRLVRGRLWAGVVAGLFGPDTLFHEPDEDLVDVVTEGFLTTGRQTTLRDFRTCDAFDVRDRLGSIDVPTLALCGAHDRMTPPRFHEYLAEEMPDCEYVELEAAAHLPMLERPDAFNTAVRSFLV